MLEPTLRPPVFFQTVMALNRNVKVTPYMYADSINILPLIITLRKRTRIKVVFMRGQIFSGEPSS